MHEHRRPVQQAVLSIIRIVVNAASKWSRRVPGGLTTVLVLASLLVLTTKVILHRDRVYPHPMQADSRARTSRAEPNAFVSPNAWLSSVSVLGVSVDADPAPLLAEVAPVSLHVDEGSEPHEEAGTSAQEVTCILPNVMLPLQPVSAESVAEEVPAEEIDSAYDCVDTVHTPFTTRRIIKPSHNREDSTLTHASAVSAIRYQYDIHPTQCTGRVYVAWTVSSSVGGSSTVEHAVTASPVILNDVLGSEPEQVIVLVLQRFRVTHPASLIEHDVCAVILGHI